MTENFIDAPEEALSGNEAPSQPETEAPEPDASMAGALSGDSGTTALPPSFAQKVATSANSLAEQQTPQQAAQPGAWARGLLGGVMDALSGFVSHGGAGPLAQKGEQERLERVDREKQQAIENQQKQQQMSREESIARATIAHENAATTHEQMLTSQLGQEYRAKNIEIGTASLGPYVKAGAGIIQQDLDSDEVKNLIATKKLDPTQQHAFPTGQRPILDANGNPELDEAGNEKFRPTYTVVGDVPQVELDEATSQLISENTPYKLPPGSKMSGLVYGTLTAQAMAAQTATQAIDEARKEAGLKAIETDQKLAAAKMLPDWGSALAKTNNNPFAALKYMETDPQMKKKYPDAATTIQGLYGGPREWETMRHDLVEEQQKAEELRQKEQSKGDYQGDPNAQTPAAFLNSLAPQEQETIKMIGEGRAPISNPGYILARKPEIMDAVSKAYPDFDASKIGAYQSAYKSFTDGKDAHELQAGAVAMQHLAQLRQLNTLKSRIPGTADNKAYENLLDTVSSELGRFYDNNTIPAIAGYRKTLGGLLNRDAAINEQAHAMGVRMDSYDEKWSEAAPSRAYEAQMPGAYAQARQARAELDPEYKQRITPSAPTPQAPKTPAPPPGSVPVQIPGQPPGWIPASQVEAFRKAHPDATVQQ